MVHASLPQGGEVVHYRDGQWWIEYPGGHLGLPGERLPVRRAAMRAARVGKPIFGLPGGQVFDRMVREERAVMAQEEAERS